MNDRNDIDSILNSMFSGGRLNVKSPAAKEAEKSLKAVQQAQEDMSQSLQKSIERMQADITPAGRTSLPLPLRRPGQRSSPPCWARRSL